MIYKNPNFVEIDVILRRGGHINQSDIVLYQFLIEYFEEIKSFYEGYQCALVQHPDGFFFLVSSKGGILKTRVLPKTCMHLGQFIAYKMLDPEITRSSGRLSIAQLMKSMEIAVPRETLLATYAPKQKEALQNTRITEEIKRSLEILKELRCINITGDIITPTEAINRFKELARHDNEPDTATREKLSLQRGVEFDTNEDAEISQEEEMEGDEDERKN